uniref:Cytochrome P450 n=1 Tax=Globisporangium ultimum (strain ATCC 200006 / CBS 805.95 / DAOM BR144) TaxID=431595 RepID=K3WMN2_GLOUD
MLAIGSLLELNAASVLLGILSLQVLAFAYHALVAVRVSRSDKSETRKVWRPDSTLPFVENTLDLVRHVPDFQDWIFSICKQFKGEPFLIKALGRPDMTVLYTPQVIEDVFKHQFACFPKGPFFIDNLKDLLGEGIFAVDDTKWVHQRKTASHLFTMRTLRDSMTTTVQTHTKVLHMILQRAADSDTPMDLFKLFNRFTIEAFAEIGFGIHLGCLDAEKEHPFQTAFDSAQREVILRFFRPGWFWKTQRWLGIGAEGRLKQNLKVIDDTVLDIVTKSLERRRTNDEPAKGDIEKDIVSLFLDNAIRDPGFEANEFDPKYLRDIVVNFLIAGRDTTAQALSWFFYNLSSHPEVVAKIRAEIAAKLPELASGKIVTPTMEQVQDLVYLEAALKETLRLHPSVPLETKHVVRDIVLSDGTFIRGGTTVALPFYGIGRMAHIWGPDAEVFSPDRWIDAQTGKLINVSAYKFVAFNAGPRLCLGMNLAMLEMKLVVSGILSKFDIELLLGQTITYDFSLTLPVHGAMMASVRKTPRQ